MTLSEEGSIRNPLRQARALCASILNDTGGNVADRAQAALAHIDQAGDAIDRMRASEEARRAAWARSTQEEAEELF